MKLELTKFDLKQKLNKRESIMFMGMLLVACLGYFKACFVPTKQKINTAQEQSQNLQNEKALLTQKLRAIQNQLPIPEIRQKHWIGTLEDIDQTVHVLTRPTQSRGVKIISFETQTPPPGKESKPSNLIKKSITLTLSGNFKTLGQYIEYLENLPAPLVIEGFSIAPDGNNPSEVILKIEGGFYASN